MTDLTPVAASDLKAVRDRIAFSKRVVIKVGSNVLVGGGAGVINRRVFVSLVEAIARLMAVPDRQIVLVSSGAVAIGRRHTSNSAAPHEPLSRKQALASIGQPLLMQAYAREFAFYDIHVSQLLMTSDDFDSRERYLNARSTLRELSKMPRVLPVINENDTVSNEEIKFGDNDHLAALVTTLFDAEALVILSDVDALYDSDPARNPDAEPVPAVYADDPELLDISGPAKNDSYGSGGMASKVRAARIASSYGVPSVIISGRQPSTIGPVLSGDAHGTVFVPRATRLPARKAWIRFGARPAGVVSIDEGAETAVRKRGKSLLPSGITGVSGHFRSGATVVVQSESGVEIARGLASYSSEDIRKLTGEKSNQIEELIGHYNGDAVIHRDDLVLTEDSETHVS